MSSHEERVNKVLTSFFKVDDETIETAKKFSIPLKDAVEVKVNSIKYTPEGIELYNDLERIIEAVSQHKINYKQ